MHSDARLFADDCLLYRHVSSCEDTVLLQKDLSALERWEEIWQMKFHPKKCPVIRIGINRRRIINTSYQPHGYTLEVVGSSTYLGVTISVDLTWRKYVEDTVIKANKTLSFVWRNISECTSRAKPVAYTTLIRPRLEYFSTVWDPHRQVTSTSWNKFKEEQLETSTKITPSVPYPGCVSNTVQSLGWESLHQRR